ncbi:DgyrCDS8475 [Dimorphilus gyrociliatus]|uniref:DgyrCDS8475 n=1 Tax=Dimorphilus gyrociliatus TaxID=2664684 RepID=A0A7I8VVZ1_9ANNE|nr:DgyrCDS8475 [Dimorphilus gyrociliatus]
MNLWNNIQTYLTEDWERCETETGLPYYVNHVLQKTQWDHPQFVKLLQSFEELDNIKFAAYRTSAKLRRLQKYLKLQQMTLSQISLAFDQQGLANNMQSYVDCRQLQNILTKIAHPLLKYIVTNKEFDSIIQQLVNLMLNLYDVKRTGTVYVTKIKVALYLYSLFENDDGKLSRQQLGALLRAVIYIPDLLGESEAFGGTNISSAVHSCFKFTDADVISEDEYMQWLAKEPQTLVWLATFHRMIAAEHINHGIKCDVCKGLPIVGFRYKCLQCFNYNLCQTCFLTCKVSRNHKLYHPTEEYCFASSAFESTRALFNIIKNNLSKKRRRKIRLRYLPPNDGKSLHIDKSDRRELEDIVRCLEMENKQLRQSLKNAQVINPTFDGERLQHLEGQLNRLKKILHKNEDFDIVDYSIYDNLVKSPPPKYVDKYQKKSKEICRNLASILDEDIALHNTNITLPDIENTLNVNELDPKSEFEELLDEFQNAFLSDYSTNYSLTSMSDRKEISSTTELFECIEMISTAFDDYVDTLLTSSSSNIR